MQLEEIKMCMQVISQLAMRIQEQAVLMDLVKQGL
jgi:hypothetical protein